MFKFISKKANKKIGKALKNVCKQYEEKTTEADNKKITRYPIEPLNYKPVVIDALRDRASLEYFRARKL